MSMIHDSSEIIVSIFFLVKYTWHPGYAVSHKHTFMETFHSFKHAVCSHQLLIAFTALSLTPEYTIYFFFIFLLKIFQMYWYNLIYCWTCLPPSVLRPKWFQEPLCAYSNSNFSWLSLRLQSICSFGLHPASMSHHWGGDRLNIRTIPKGFSKLYQSYAFVYET